MPVWSPTACEALMGCFECTDWDMFFEANESQNDDLLDCITSYIQWCKDNIIETKSVKVYANNKPWVS